MNLGAQVTLVSSREQVSAKSALKMRPTATGATTYGSSALIRQNVRARMWRSSIAAMKRARISCGTLESRKMLNVFRSATQNFGWDRIHAYWSNPTNSPERRI